MGDSADNFPGCPGVGEKTAVKLINQFGNIDNMLNHTDELKGKMREKVENAVDDIRMSKFLATIRTDVPIELNLDELAVTSPDEKKLTELFTELEFKTLANKFLKKDKPVQKEVKTQLDLFQEFAPESSEAPKTRVLRAIKRCLTNTNSLIMRRICVEFVIFSYKTKTILRHRNDLNRRDFGRISRFELRRRAFQSILCACSRNREEAMKVLEIFRPVYESERILKVGQNVKYDLEVLANYGIELKGEMFDTMIAHYLLQPELRHNMDYMAEVYLNYQTIHIDELIGPRGKNQKSMRDVPPADVCEYASEDADITLQLYNALEPKLKESDLYPLFRDIEMPLVRVLAEMEMNGVLIDTNALKETSVAFTERMLELERKIYEEAGEEFNISSPRQVGDILFEKLKIVEKAKKTKTGQYVTSEEVLQQLKNKAPIVSNILAYRGLKKLLGTYVDALPKLINPRTGHIHTSFNQTVTATGRLSSSDPNLQNIPVRGEDGKDIRRCFIPEPGCLFFQPITVR